MQYLPWIVALATLALLALALGVWGWRNSKAKRLTALPTEWALAARPVFSGDERRVHRLLREALPHHVVLLKLPLVRFCQPSDPHEVRYWYSLLGSSHITFAVCSANGRVLAAIDLDSDRGESRRRMQIKQSVLSACRVRYLRCAVDQLPSAAELQLLVPSASPAPRAPRPTPLGPRRAQGGIGTPPASHRNDRTALWQDTTVFQDSFFNPDSRLDSFGNSHFATFPEAPRPGASPMQVPHRDDAEAYPDPGFDKGGFRYPDLDFEQSLDDPDDFGGHVADSPRFYSDSRSDSRR